MLCQDKSGNPARRPFWSTKRMSLIWISYRALVNFQSGLPDGMFSNQKFQSG
jgi:hypothetical protein